MFLPMEGSSKYPSGGYTYQWKGSNTDGLWDHYTYQICPEVGDPRTFWGPPGFVHLVKSWLLKVLLLACGRFSLPIINSESSEPRG